MTFLFDSCTSVKYHDADVQSGHLNGICPLTLAGERAFCVEAVLIFFTRRGVFRALVYICKHIRWAAVRVTVCAQSIMSFTFIMSLITSE